MKKKYLKLTRDQKKRGVIFSSVLLPSESPTLHEVCNDNEDTSKIIKRLKDDSFFNYSCFEYNEIRS